MILFGIDIGGTTIKIGAFQEDKTLLSNWEIKTQPQNLFNDLADSVKSYLELEHISFAEVFGFGLGIPGIVKNGIAISCVNLGWENVNIKEELEKALGFFTHVIVLNDANMAAFGEASFCNQEVESAVFLTLGTGVGGGIMIHHEIVEGSNGLGGELGHIPLDTIYNFPCSCGLRGCLETLASSKGMIKLAHHFKNEISTQLTINEALSAKDIIDGAKHKDPLAMKVFETACSALARAMAGLAVIINPDTFIIGGGISNAGEFLLTAVQNKYKKVCIKQAQSIPIYLAKLKNNAGIYGACAYLIQKKIEVEKNGKC